MGMCGDTAGGSTYLFINGSLVLDHYTATWESAHTEEEE